MIVDVECRNCGGGGRQHSPGRNGDPMDNGVDCERCGGTGVEQVDQEDEIEDWMR